MGQSGTYVSEEFCHAYKAHLLALSRLELLGWESIGVSKHHQVAHMVADTMRYGHPRDWGCWKDEAKHLNLRKAAQSSHRMVWHARVLVSVRNAVGLGASMMQRCRRRRRR